MVVLALPVQGIAAATMRFCAPGQHSKTVGSQSAQTPHHHGMHAPASAAPHQHDEQPAVDIAGDDSKEGQATASKMKCSVCAVCCMAAALAPDTPRVYALEAVSMISLPASVSYVGPVADGLERPPRPFLA
jgi:hypothetical protein